MNHSEVTSHSSFSFTTYMLRTDLSEEMPNSDKSDPNPISTSTISFSHNILEKEHGIVRNSEMTICWTVKDHLELKTTELYDILRLRNAVYIVELKCPVGDTDGEDLNEGTFHLTGYHQETGRLVAYLRMHAVDDGKVKIRRVVVAKEFRGNGVARTLMIESINWCKLQKAKSIVLAARVHLREFYKSLGFREVSEDYYLEEVGVWHIDMELSL